MGLYRLYLDEAGDHTFSKSEDVGKRYLGLVGCSIRREDEIDLHERLEAIKRKHLRYYDPDDPPVLHRKEIYQACGAFYPLQDPKTRAAFDHDLLQVIEQIPFRLIVVVIDKNSHQRATHRRLRHPYHYCMQAMLERYCGWLKFSKSQGDVMAEQRGGTEDMELKRACARFYRAGSYYFSSSDAQAVLTTKALKVKSKQQNIAGLQLADILSHPMTRLVLVMHGVLDNLGGTFAEALTRAVEQKWNRQVYQGRIRGYGQVFLT